MALLLVQSVVEYLLRMAALMAVFAWAVAVLIASVGVWARQDERSLDDRHPHSDAGAAPSLAATEPAKEGRPFVPAPPRDDSPAAWRTPMRPKPPEN